MIAQHSYQSYFRLPFENTGDEKNSSDGLAEIGALSLITLRHTEERVSSEIEVVMIGIWRASLFSSST